MIPTDDAVGRAAVVRRGDPFVPEQRPSDDWIRNSGATLPEAFV